MKKCKFKKLILNKSLSLKLKFNKKLIIQNAKMIAVMKNNYNKNIKPQMKI